MWQIAAHVLGQHRFREVGDTGTAGAQGHVEPLEEDADEQALAEQGASDMYVKHNTLLHGPQRQDCPPPFHSAFLRKYIAYVKRRTRCSTPPCCRALRALLAEAQTGESTRPGWRC